MLSYLPDRAAWTAPLLATRSPTRADAAAARTRTDATAGRDCDTGRITHAPEAAGELPQKLVRYAANLSRHILSYPAVPARPPLSPTTPWT